jgi:hypothetical protein
MIKVFTIAVLLLVGGLVFAQNHTKDESAINEIGKQVLQLSI